MCCFIQKIKLFRQPMINVRKHWIKYAYRNECMYLCDNYTLMLNFVKFLASNRWPYVYNLAQTLYMYVFLLFFISFHKRIFWSLLFCWKTFRIIFLFSSLRVHGRDLPWILKSCFACNVWRVCPGISCRAGTPPIY